MARLKPGDMAPYFTLESVNSGTVSLGGLMGRRVLLALGRYFGCPACQAEFDDITAFATAHPGLAVVYVTQSSPESARSCLEGRGVGFPVCPASKVEGRYPLYELYGAGRMGPVGLLQLVGRGRKARAAGKRHGEYEGIETQSPAQFLIDPEGRIEYAHYGLLDPEEVGRLTSGS